MVARRKGVVGVPVNARQVREFVESNRQKFENDLRHVRGVLDQLKENHSGFRSVYKIYSRGEMQGLDEIKVATKIGHKFNEYNLAKGVEEGSLFAVPDIVGLTVVVPYPSGITRVASAIDQSIDSRDLLSVDLDGGDDDTGIVTKYGRPLGKRGYFACHYNVRAPGPGENRPIVEIQVKTLLHDAWGAKTHDLTYKPRGKVGVELLESFDLLGDSLANIDKQSDALRVSILRSAEVRERKRRAVQIAALNDITEAAIAGINDGSTKTRLQEFHRDVMEMNLETQEKFVFDVAKGLFDIFNDGRKAKGSGSAVSRLLCLLTAVTRNSFVAEKAQDTMDERESAAKSENDRLKVGVERILALFAGGDVSEAIDVGEELYRDAERVSSKGFSDKELLDLARTKLALKSNVAYFYADIIGSYDGDKREAKTRAKQGRKEATALYLASGFPAGGIESSETEIVAAISSDSDLAEQAFYSLDNEAYLRIQCAETVDEVIDVKKKLEVLHRNTPSTIKRVAKLAIDYHDFCARTRLSEIERSQ